MRIVVTGASGFVGRHFVRHAHAAGHDVVALHRRSASHSDPRRTHRNKIPVRFADVLDREALDSAVAGADCVCHFAAAFAEAHAADEHFDQVNVKGTANVMAAANAAGAKRFVYCSTAGIYGKLVPGTIDESREPRPFNSYERSKVAAEQEVRRLARAYGMEYVILRPSQVYGPGDKRLAKLYRNASRGRFPLFGRGEGRRHMVYVGDLVEAFLRACTRPGAANREMIIAGPEAVRLREILQMLAELSNQRTSGPQLPLKPMLFLAGLVEDVCRLFNVKAPLHRRRMDFYLSDTEYDCSHARDVLGWKPKVHVRKGLQLTLSEETALASAASAAVTRSVWVTKVAMLGEGIEAAQPYFALVTLA